MRPSPPTSSCFRPVIPPRRHVETHDLCVRCVKGYSVVVLTGTDAQIVRPYIRYSVRASLQRTTRLALMRTWEFSNRHVAIGFRVVYRRLLFAIRTLSALSFALGESSYVASWGDMGSIALEKGVEYQLYFAAANNFYPPSVDSSWVAANDCIDIAHGSAYYGDDATLIFSGTVVLQET